MKTFSLLHKLLPEKKSPLEFQMKFQQPLTQNMLTFAKLPKPPIRSQIDLNMNTSIQITNDQS